MAAALGLESSRNPPGRPPKRARAVFAAGTFTLRNTAAAHTLNAS